MRNPFAEELARRNLLEFTKFTLRKFAPNWFHETYYDKLQQFADGKIKNLMVFVPPQHGKSEGSTRRLPAYMLGKNPDLKIGLVSYNAPKARKFNREIQRIITDQPYKYLFPGTSLNRTNVTAVAGQYLRNMDECEIVGREGGFKTVGVGGALTGEAVDILILDDIYKDAKTAWSETVRKGIEDWYNTVADSRLHNDSQVLIVFTRWHEADLAGYLLGIEGQAEDGGRWHVVTFPAIKEGKPNDYDPRKDGEPLWPEKHSLAKLLATKNRDSHTFNSLYQQNPKPIEGLLYKIFRTYKEIPSTVPIIKAVIDTADTGDDFLCMIIYRANVYAYYVIDILYTQEGMEVTEDKAAVMLSKHKVHKCRVESNNGGRSYARAVEKICREHKNTLTTFSWYHQTENKEIRIFTHAAEVQNMVQYPEDWEKRWPAFAKHVKGYMAKGKNLHDDAEDCLTMMVETEGRIPIALTEQPQGGPGGESELDAIKAQYL